MAHMHFVELSVVFIDCVYRGYERSRSAELNKKHHIYQDSTGNSASQIQQNNKNQNVSELQSNASDASDQSDCIEPSLESAINPIEPSLESATNPIIQNSFYTMYENPPFETSNIPKKKPQEQIFSYFKVKKINNSNNIKSETQTEKQFEWFYDNKREQTELFYKQIGLSFEEVITNFKERDIVLMQKYNYESLPHMEHYFILLYYGNKQYTIEQLQHLWIKLYNLYYKKMKQNKYMSTIYIITNINIFNILFDQQFGIDLYKLKSVIKQFYYQYNPKCIQSEGKQAIKSMETVPHDCKVIIRYNRSECMSVVDETFSFMQSNVIHMSRCPSVEAPIRQFAEVENDNAIFGFVKSKTAVVAGVFGIVATVGMKMLRAYHYRVN